LNYCAIATLSFLSQTYNEQVSIQELASHTGLDIASCARWMLERQTTWIEDDDDDDDDDDEEEQDETDVPVLKGQPAEDPSSNNSALQELDAIAGFCGRSGKIADTCYCFWNVGALTVVTSKERH
jgi:geranylgeranyl transferase type-1 subunit beta